MERFYILNDTKMLKWSYKNKVERRLAITGILLFCIICGVSLFVFSNSFVSAEITPKWLGMMISVGLAGITWSMLNGKISFYVKPLVLFICCFLFIFVRKWITSDFNTPLLIYLCGLLLLCLIVKQIVNDCKHQYLLGTVIVFALALSVQVILQYIGLLPFGKNNFPVTGNFDNPAGFSAALVCALPLCFLFLKHEKRYLRYAVMVAATLMAIAVFLSGSRAGIMAVAVAATIWLLSQSKFTYTEHLRNINKKTKNFLTIVLLCALPFVLYFIKKDSADGRLLIWQCSLNMVVDKPLFGHGYGAFQAKYMLYQAEYMNAHPESRFVSLADNVLHPFNEYLLLLTEHGLTGLSLVFLLGFFLFRAYRRKPDNEKLSAMISLLALSVFSFFSYPFRYPFTWVLLFLNVAIIYNNSEANIFSFNTFFKKRFVFSKTYPQTITILLYIGLLTYSVILTRAEMTWKRVARFSLEMYYLNMRNYTGGLARTFFFCIITPLNCIKQRSLKKVLQFLNIVYVITMTWMYKCFWQPITKN